MALYNEVRPQTLSELKGQEDVKKILRKSVANGTLPNAALFAGTRGTGKTTVARILAKMVNCENPRENKDPCCECPSCASIRDGKSLDVIELDAASNNGVDDVRRIIELVQYQTISNKKVIILDECHMLSKEAFNALLKVLEEPPKDVLFILCTTEVHKVPATILSRCRRFSFKSLSIAEITSKLREIADGKGKKAEDEALRLVAKAANGSMRDAESIFESFLEMDEITAAEVRKVLGFTSEERIVRILAAVTDGQPWVIRDAIEEAADRGENLNLMIEEMIGILVKMASVMLIGDVGDNSSDVTELCFKYSTSQVFDLISALKKTYEAKPSNMAVSLLATLVGQACAEDRIAELSRELEALKANGIATTASAVPAAEEPAEKEGASSDEDAEDEEWSRLLGVAEFEDVSGFADASDVPFKSEEFTKKTQVAPAVNESAPTEEKTAAGARSEEAPKSVISKRAMSSLAAAGFIVEGAEEASESPERESVEKKQETEKKEEKEEDAFNLFASLFNF